MSSGPLRNSTDGEAAIMNTKARRAASPSYLFAWSFAAFAWTRARFGARLAFGYLAGQGFLATRFFVYFFNRRMMGAVAVYEAVAWDDVSLFVYLHLNT